MRRNRGVLLIVALLALALVAGCGQGSGSASGLEKVKKAGKIVFATDDTYPPMEYRDEQTQELVGFDIDLAKAIAGKLGVEAAFEPTDWDGLLTGLQTDKYDAVISTMNVTEERLENADFAEYAILDQVFVIAKGGKPVTSSAELSGLRVAVQVETTSQEIAEGVPGTTITTFDSFDQAFLEVRNGKADVVVVDEPVGLYYEARHSDVYTVSGYADEAAPVGIAVKKGSDLKAAIDKAIADLKADGTYQQLSEKWFGRDISQR